MKKQYFDLVVIGSGPGGYVAAIRAAQLNLKVAIIEKSDLGGVCLNWGCIPTKSLLRSSEILNYIKSSESYGITTEKWKINLQDMTKRSRNIAKKLSNGIEYLLKKNKITLFRGMGYINKNKDIEVKLQNETLKIEFNKAIIATGAIPKKIVNANKNTNKVWTYTEALLPDAIPKTLGIIGAGAIGIEFASFYNALGSRVKIYESQDHIVPNEDIDISRALKSIMEKKGIEFHTSTNVIDIKVNDSVILKTNANEKNIFQFDKILVAIGVEGNVNGLGIENTNVKVVKGQIVTNSYGKTDDEKFFAIGDVAGTPWLAHKASHEGLACVEFIAGKSKNSNHNIKKSIPSCVYSHPQVASIGITEQIAKNKGIKVKVGNFPLNANGKALSLTEEEGFVKTIFSADTGEILGAHMIGHEVTELINSFSLAVQLEATEEDIFNTIFPHPTLSESIHESVLDAFGRAIHI